MDFKQGLSLYEFNVNIFNGFRYKNTLLSNDNFL